MTAPTSNVSIVERDGRVDLLGLTPEQTAALAALAWNAYEMQIAAVDDEVDIKPVLDQLADWAACKIAEGELE